MTHRFDHSYGRLPVLHSAPVALHAKSVLGDSGDKYEEEAERAAEQVMQLAQQERSCECGGACPECRKEQASHAQANDSTRRATSPLVDKVLRSPGRPLDTATRVFFEPRFGHDFANVRIHSDVGASDAARAVNARAFTVGQNVVFADGEYAPHSRGGQKLLAHDWRTSRSKGRYRARSSVKRPSQSARPFGLTSASTAAQWQMRRL